MSLVLVQDFFRESSYLPRNSWRLDYTTPILRRPWLRIISGVIRANRFARIGSSSESCESA